MNIHNADNILVRTLKNYKKDLLVISLVMLGQALVTIVQPWPLRSLIDYVINSPEYTKNLTNKIGLIDFIIHTSNAFISGGKYKFIFSNIGLLILIYGAGSLLLYLHNLFLTSLGQKVVLSIRLQLFDHIISLPQSFYEKIRAGDITSRVSKDATDINVMLESLLTVAVRSCPTILGIIIMSYIVDWVYASVFLLVIPIIYTTNVIFAKQMRLAIKEQRKVEGQLASLVQEAVTEHKAVSAFGLEDILLEDLKLAGVESSEYAVKVGRFQGLLVASVDGVFGITTLFITFVGIMRIMHGCLTVGQLVIFLSYLASLFKPIREISKFSLRWAKSMAALDRIQEIMHIGVGPINLKKTNIKTQKRVKQFQGHIKYSNVSFGYTPGKYVIKDFSLEIKPGEQIAIVGGSGSGKSTILHLLLRFYDPDRGQIMIDGHDIKTFDPVFLRKQMSVVLQDSHLFRMTIRENIAIARPEATEEDIVAAAKAAEAHEFIMSLPRGYDTLLGEGGVGLSGGQKRRLAIARAVLRNTPIVLMDEPTAGLDAASEQAVIKALKRLIQNRTTILVTHQLSTITDFQRIVVMDMGKIIEQGTHEELIRLKQKYWELWQLQQST